MPPSSDGTSSARAEQALFRARAEHCLSLAVSLACYLAPTVILTVYVGQLAARLRSNKQEWAADFVSWVFFLLDLCLLLFICCSASAVAVEAAQRIADDANRESGSYGEEEDDGENEEEEVGRGKKLRRYLRDGSSSLSSAGAAPRSSSGTTPAAPGDHHDVAEADEPGPKNSWRKRLSGASPRARGPRGGFWVSLRQTFVGVGGTAGTRRLGTAVSDEEEEEEEEEEDVTTPAAARLSHHNDHDRSRTARGGPRHRPRRPPPPSPKNPGPKNPPSLLEAHLGGLQWILYVWINAPKISLLYFTLMPHLDPTEMFGPRVLSFTITGFAFFYASLMFRSFRVLYMTQSVSIDAMLFQDMAWHVTMDFVDIV